MLNDCAAAALVHDADLQDRLPAADDVPALRLRVSVGGASAGSEAFAALLAGAAAPAPATVQEEDVAAIMYTSGTTGNPKGALYSHRSTILHSYASTMPDSRMYLPVRQ